MSATGEDRAWRDMVSAWQAPPRADGARATRAMPRVPGTMRATCTRLVSPPYAAPTREFAAAVARQSRWLVAWWLLTALVLGSAGFFVSIWTAGLALRVSDTLGKQFSHLLLLLPVPFAVAFMRIAWRWRGRAMERVDVIDAWLADLDTAPVAAVAAAQDGSLERDIVMYRPNVALLRASAAMAALGFAWQFVSLPLARHYAVRHPLASVVLGVGLGVASIALGVGLLVGGGKEAWFARRTRVRAHASERGLEAGTFTLSPQEIAQLCGRVVRTRGAWGVARAWRVSLLRMPPRVFDTSAFDAEVASAHEGEELLRAMGLGPERQRFEMLVTGPLWKLGLALPPVHVVLGIYVEYMHRVTQAPRWIALTWLVLGALSSLALFMPARLVVGSDGVSRSWLGWRRFFAFANVSGVSAHGTRVQLACSKPHRGVRFDCQHDDAAASLAERIASAWQAYGRGVAHATHGAHDGAAHYRVLALTDDALVAMVDDSRAAVEERVRAARMLALRRPSWPESAAAPCSACRPTPSCERRSGRCQIR